MSVQCNACGKVFTNPSNIYGLHHCFDDQLIQDALDEREEMEEALQSSPSDYTPPIRIYPRSIQILEDAASTCRCCTDSPRVKIYPRSRLINATSQSCPPPSLKDRVTVQRSGPLGNRRPPEILIVNRLTGAAKLPALPRLEETPGEEKKG